MLQGCVPGGERGPTGRTRTRCSRSRPKYQRWCHKKALARKRAFHTCQYRFHHDPARTAAEVLNGRVEGRCPIPEEIVFNSFRAKWGDPPPIEDWAGSGPRGVLTTLTSWGRSPRARSNKVSGRRRTTPHRVQMGLGNGTFSIGTLSAFDSFSHEHILSALGQINVDPHVVGLIQQIYTNSSTSVEIGGRNTPDIEVRVGVKQGDPLSPLLFNLAMDPLIHGLERFGKGYIVGDGLSVVCLAFADDLVVIGGSWSDMAYNLGLLDSFCQSTGLKVQPAKCRSFLVKPCSGSFSVNDCAPWVLGGRALQQTTIAETVKYLGVKINPWSGVTGPNVVEALDRWVRNIGKSLLKPSQRVVLLNQFALPRLYYQADLGEVTDGVLRAADGKIRGAVKKWVASFAVHL
ncbi:unnamed protein product [Leuciscus chuanchicus]